MSYAQEVQTLSLTTPERERLQQLVVRAHQHSIGRADEVELRRLMAKEYHNDYLLTVPQETLVGMGIWLIGVWGVRKLTHAEGSLAGPA